MCNMLQYSTASRVALLLCSPHATRCSFLVKWSDNFSKSMQSVNSFSEWLSSTTHVRKCS